MLPTDVTSTFEKDDKDTTSEIRTCYLGVQYRLQRKGEGKGGKRNKLFVNGSMTHYITDVNWYALRWMDTCLMEFPKLNAVFLKSHKQFWDQVATGRVMSFFEVLDCLIVDNYDLRASHSFDLLLPVDLSVSEQKLLKVLNLAGLVLQTKKAFGVLPAVLTLTSVVLEFITPIREWIYGTINIVFCWAMHIICDKLPYSTRKQIYSLVNWAENLKPSNDIEFRAVKGDHIRAVIGGGAKASSLPSVLREEDVDWLSQDSPMTFGCGDHIQIQCQYANYDSAQISFIRTEDGKKIGYQSLRCNNGHSDFLKICTFISCVGKNRCGSLKSYCHDNKKVRVRSLMESTICYVLNECPPVYVLAFEKGH